MSTRFLTHVAVVGVLVYFRQVYVIFCMCVCECATDSLILFSDLSSDFGRYFYGKRLKKIEKKRRIQRQRLLAPRSCSAFHSPTFQLYWFLPFFIIISYFKVWFCQYSHNKNISHILYSYRYIISHTRNTVRGLKSWNILHSILSQQQQRQRRLESAAIYLDVWTQIYILFAVYAF